MARFADILSDETKRGCKIQTGEYLPFGKYPIIDQGQSQIAGYTNLENGLFKDIPTIIFGDHTRIVKYVDTPFFLGADGVKILKTKVNDADYKYLFYCLQNAKIPNTGYNRHFKWLKEIEIPLPPLEEQRKIAAVLDKVSDLIAKRRTQLDKLDEMVKSRFIEMFGEKYPFDKIENLIDRKIVSAKKIFSQHDVIKYIDISSIDNIKNKIDRYTEYQMTDAPSRAQQCIKENDIIVSTVRPNLKNIAINQMKYDNLVVSSGFCVLRPKKCNPLYLFIALLQDNFTNKMIEKTTGANYPAIKDSDVYLFQIPLPPIELQNQFAAFVKQTDKSKLAIQKNLEKLEILKKSLMQKYFD